MNRNRRVDTKVLLSIAAMIFLFFPFRTVCFSQPVPDPSPAPPAIAPLPLTEEGSPATPEAPEIKQLGENRVQIGAIVVDTKKKEVTVPGRMLPDQTLEFLATKKNGMKSYESAMELETDAVSFNLAMIMIGLERTNAVAPEHHFDTAQVVGDPVELWVEWNTGNRTRKAKAGELLYDLEKKSVPQLGQWVYTGSGFLPDGQYLAELDGVLIGFIHTPASIIENSSGAGIGAYGSIRLNPELNIAPDTPIKLTVRALQK